MANPEPLFYLFTDYPCPTLCWFPESVVFSQSVAVNAGMVEKQAGWWLSRTRVRTSCHTQCDQRISVLGSLLFIIVSILLALEVISFRLHWGQRGGKRGKTMVCWKSEAASLRELCIKSLHRQLKHYLHLMPTIHPFSQSLSPSFLCISEVFHVWLELQKCCCICMQAHVYIYTSI